MGGISKFKNNIKNKVNLLEIEKETLRNIITGNIYQIMGKEGITIQQISCTFNVTDKYIKIILSGNYNFSIDTLFEICYFLGYTPQITFIKNNKKGEK